MQYEFINEENRKDILKSTITSIEQEHYANALALTRAQAIEDEAQIKQFEDILERLQKQHSALSALPKKYTQADGA